MVKENDSAKSLHPELKNLKNIMNWKHIASVIHIGPDRKDVGNQQQQIKSWSSREYLDPAWKYNLLALSKLSGLGT